MFSACTRCVEFLTTVQCAAVVSHIERHTCFSRLSNPKAFGFVASFRLAKRSAKALGHASVVFCRFLVRVNHEFTSGSRCASRPSQRVSSQAALYIYAKLHSPEGQQHTALLTIIEVFGAFFLELDVEVPRHNIIEVLDSGAQLLQRIDCEISVPVSSEWIEFDRISAAQVSPRRRLATAPRVWAAECSHGLCRAAGQLLGG